METFRKTPATMQDKYCFNIDHWPRDAERTWIEIHGQVTI